MRRHFLMWLGTVGGSPHRWTSSANPNPPLLLRGPEQAFRHMLHTCAHSGGGPVFFAGLTVPHALMFLSGFLLDNQ